MKQKAFVPLSNAEKLYKLAEIFERKYKDFAFRLL